MKDNVKRLLAFVLAAVMLVSLCPTLGCLRSHCRARGRSSPG